MEEILIKIDNIVQDIGKEEIQAKATDEKGNIYILYYDTTEAYKKYIKIISKDTTTAEQTEELKKIGLPYLPGEMSVEEACNWYKPKKIKSHDNKYYRVISWANIESPIIQEIKIIEKE